MNDACSEIDRLEKTLGELVAESQRLEAQMEAIKSQRLLNPVPDKNLLSGAEIVPPAAPH